MPDYLKQYLEYIRNAGTGAIRARFVEDWEPIGERVFVELYQRRLVHVYEGRLHLSDEGKLAIGTGGEAAP